MKYMGEVYRAVFDVKIYIDVEVKACNKVDSDIVRGKKVHLPADVSF